jgi:hypothetical protein
MHHKQSNNRRETRSAGGATEMIFNTSCSMAAAKRKPNKILQGALNIWESSPGF